MKRLVWGCVLGVLVASAARGAEQVEKLEEVSMETVGRTTFKVPEGYGRLVNVVVNNEVHYLYFEDQTGVIRVVLVGPRGAAPRARNALYLLAPDVYRITRGDRP